MGAGVHIDGSDDTLHLGHDHSRIARLQGRNVLRGVVDRNQLCSLDFYRDPGGTLRLSAADGASAAA